MAGDVTPNQLLVLQWIAEGCPDDGRWPKHNGHKAGARALANRKLIVINSSYRGWSAEITPSGTHYLTHGDYPPDHRFHNLDLTPVPRRTEEEIEADTGQDPPRRRGRPKATPPKRPEPEFEIDSPRQKRGKGIAQSNQTDTSATDPWDEKILVSVKEAAWLLSLPEGTIRKAAVDGDLQRVFIGAGATHYRIVYNSLLAWVDSMPREAQRTWSRW